MMKVNQKLKGNPFADDLRLVVSDADFLIKVIERKTGHSLPNAEIPAYGCTFSIPVSDTNIVNIIWLPNFEWRVPDIAFLGHEVFHVVDKIFEQIGEEDRASEARAYYYQYIFSQALEILRKIKLGQEG